jgi:ABC-type antimicrobial peptide transport system permease subunit
LRLASLGLGVGLLFGFILSRVISSVLFQVGPATPQLLGGGAACLAIVAMAAMYIPVRRAMKVDPNKTLRYE